MAVGAKLETARKAVGWTKVVLCERAKFPMRTLSDYVAKEDGQEIVKVGMLARALGVSLDWVANNDLPDDQVPEWAWTGRAWMQEGAATMGTTKTSDDLRTAQVIPLPTEPSASAPAPAYDDILAVQDLTESFEQREREARRSVKASSATKAKEPASKPDKQPAKGAMAGKPKE